MTVVDDNPPRTQERVLKAKAASNAHALAGAIAAALHERGSVQVNGVGASAVNQMVKATAIARGHLAVRGLDVVCAPGMENTQGNPRPGTSGGDELTRVVLRIWTVER